MTMPLFSKQSLDHFLEVCSSYRWEEIEAWFGREQHVLKSNLFLHSAGLFRDPLDKCEVVVKTSTMEKEFHLFLTSFFRYGSLDSDDTERIWKFVHHQEEFDTEILDWESAIDVNLRCYRRMLCFFYYVKEKEIRDLRDACARV